MKLLLVRGEGDYGALDFERKFSGLDVTSAIASVEKGGTFVIPDEDLVVSVHEFKDVDIRFIDFIRREIQDYDQSKHMNFWIEGETI